MSNITEKRTTVSQYVIFIIFKEYLDFLMRPLYFYNQVSMSFKKLKSFFATQILVSDT